MSLSKGVEMRNDSNEMLEFTGIVKVDTGKAYLINVDDTEVWIPDSKIDCIDEPRIGKEIDFEIPRWLAEIKELI